MSLGAFSPLSNGRLYFTRRANFKFASYCTEPQPTSLPVESLKMTWVIFKSEGFTINTHDAQRTGIPSYLKNSTSIIFPQCFSLNTKAWSASVRILTDKSHSFLRLRFFKPSGVVSDSFLISPIRILYTYRVVVSDTLNKIEVTEFSTIWYFRSSAFISMLIVNWLLSSDIIIFFYLNLFLFGYVQPAQNPFILNLPAWIVFC